MAHGQGIEPLAGRPTVKLERVTLACLAPLSMFSPDVYARLRAQLPNSVKLVAVTKTRAIAELEAAYGAGVRDFAESRVQEALPKIEALEHLPGLRWHFIGPLQGNKARKVVEHFDWIHSVHNLALAQRLDRLMGEMGRYPQTLLQVKLLPDDRKGGWTQEQLQTDLKELITLAKPVQGLMTILPFGLSPAERLTAFENTAHLAQWLRENSPWPLPELSMGMSGDYPEAVAAGATMVRLGTILFGDRPSTLK